MRNKAIAGAILSAMLTGWMSSANAASVTLTPDNGTVNLGEFVTFTYTMDFTDDSTFGGGTDFFYDNTILEFVGWSFDGALTSDEPGLRNDPTDCLSANSDAGCGFDPNEFGPGLAQINGMAFGNSAGSGMSGPDVIGQLVFQAVGTGSATIFMSANDDGVAGNPGPFVSGNTFAVQDVTFNYGHVTVGAQVPLPAAAWLMLGGLGALGGLRRRAA